MAKKKIQTCSFCGRESSEVENLIVSKEHGQTVAICSKCIELSYNIIKSSQQEEPENEEQQIATPSEIKKFLDQYVIAQEEAKIKAAVSVYNHLKRAKYNENIEDEKDKLDNTNIIELGVSGVGKTLIWRTIAKMMNVPCVIWDASNLSSTGYAGADVTDILAYAIREAEGDIELAEKSIIIIDEADKIARKSGSNVSFSKDVSGESVQQGLLKILEGSDIEVPMESRRTTMVETVSMNTSNILFILNGAFEGIEKIIARRMNKKKIGFGEEQKEYSTDEYISFVTSQDLIDYGILPEIIGRAPAIITLHALTEEHLIDILTEPKNAIVKQYQEIFKMDNVNLVFSNEILRKIAHSTIEKKTNARGLRSIVEYMLAPIMYRVPDREDVKQVVILESLSDEVLLMDNSKVSKKKNA